MARATNRIPVSRLIGVTLAFMMIATTIDT
jgi:hypothetical protein